ncbi:MAG: hypothetical protein JO212_15025 [Acetobacteraceae bacterium]|nr:hypothetical protein [Acetobacteraceae bacterium]
MPRQSPAPTATIIPFPGGRILRNRLTELEWKDALEWEESMRHLGYAQVSLFHQRNPAGQIIDSLSIYWKGDLWIVRSVPGRERRFGVWRHGDESILAERSSLKETLEVISAPPARGKAGARESNSETRRAR